MEKMTYAKALDYAIANLDAEDVIEKLSALKESLMKKNSAERKPTVQQEENAGIKNAILDGMESGRGYTITDLTKEIPELVDVSNQRASALVRQMVEAGLVSRETIKRKAYFTKVEG